MSVQQLRFALTAYDPNPVEVLLNMTAEACTVEQSGSATIEVDDYKTDADGNPHEIYLKVTPQPIAFIMRFVNGQMTIEFKGNWSMFKDSLPKPIASSVISFKTHLKAEDVNAFDIQLNWKSPDIAAFNGDGKYFVVFQKDVQDGREFILVCIHPETGEKYVLRCVISSCNKITIFNTDIWKDEELEHYLAFYIKDEGRVAVIMKEIEENPDSKIGILYKHGCFGEGVDLGSLIPYIQHNDADGNPIASTDKPEDDHVKKGRESREKSEATGKKGCGPPEDDGKDWSCGRVKWELPGEDRTYRDVGKLKIPEFKQEEEGPHTKDVGKLQWGGFEEEKEEKEVRKVGKLNLGAFGGAAAEDAAPPPKRSWKKKKEPAA